MRPFYKVEVCYLFIAYCISLFGIAVSSSSYSAKSGGEDHHQSSIITSQSHLKDDESVTAVEVNRVFQSQQSWYYLSSHALGAEEASRFCGERGMHLLSIESEEENNFIRDYLRSSTKPQSIWISREKKRKARGRRNVVQEDQTYSFQDDAEFNILQSRKNCSRCRCKEIPECGQMPKCTIRLKPCTTEKRYCSHDPPTCTILRGNCSTSCPCEVETPPCITTRSPQCHVEPGKCETTRPKCKTVPTSCRVVTRKLPCNTKPNTVCKIECEEVQPDCYETVDPCYDDWEKCDDRLGQCPRRVCPRPRRVCPPLKSSCHPPLHCTPVVCQSPVTICEDPKTHCPSPVTKCMPAKVVCGEPEIHCPEPKLNCPENMRGANCPKSVACPSVVTHCVKPKLRCTPPAVKCESPILNCEKPPPCSTPTSLPLPDPECPNGFEDCCDNPRTTTTVRTTKAPYYQERPTEGKTWWPTTTTTTTTTTTLRPIVTMPTTTTPCPICPTYPPCPTYPCPQYNCPTCPTYYQNLYQHQYYQYPYTWNNDYPYYNQNSAQQQSPPNYADQTGQYQNQIYPSSQFNHNQSDQSSRSSSSEKIERNCDILNKDREYQADKHSCLASHHFICESEELKGSILEVFRQN